MAGSDEVKEVSRSEAIESGGAADREGSQGRHQFALEVEAIGGGRRVGQCEVLGGWRVLQGQVGVGVVFREFLRRTQNPDGAPDIHVSELARDQPLQGVRMGGSPNTMGGYRRGDACGLQKGGEVGAFSVTVHCGSYLRGQGWAVFFLPRDREAPVRVGWVGWMTLNKKIL